MYYYLPGFPLFRKWIGDWGRQQESEIKRERERQRKRERER